MVRLFKTVTEKKNTYNKTIESVLKLTNPMNITEINLMISTSLFHINQVTIVCERIRGSSDRQLFCFCKQQCSVGTLDVLLNLLTCSLLFRLVRKIYFSFDRVGLLFKELLPSNCSAQIWHLTYNSQLARSPLPNKKPLSTFQHKTKACGNGSIYILPHTSSIYQGEVAGCQPVALSQYLITVQLCREKETFHLPITWL